nr:TdsD1 [uncultured bacterium]
MSHHHHPKHAAPDHDILQPIRERWSPRAFDPNRDVSRGDLHRLFEAARWASSSYNEQPWRFVVTGPRTSPEPHAALMASLTTSNQAWAKAAPVLILVAAATTLTKTGEANALAWYDTGQGVAQMIVQATSMGIGVRQMQGFDSVLARAACRVPEAFDPVVVLAIGYAGDPEGLASEKHRAQEREPRRRRAIAEFVFEGTWA